MLRLPAREILTEREDVGVREKRDGTPAGSILSLGAQLPIQVRCANHKGN